MVGLGAQARHPEHHPHRRPVHPRLRPDRQGRGAGGRRRRHRPHQRRPHGAAATAMSASCASSCTRAIEIVHNGNEQVGASLRCAGRASSSKRSHRVILGTDCAGGLGRAAARHPAHDRAAVIARRHPGRDGLLLRHRQHRAHAQARLRADRARAARPTSCSSTGPAHRRAGPARERRSWATCPASAW